MNIKDNIIRNLLISEGVVKTLKLFGGYDKPITNFLKNNNFIYELIDNLTLEHLKRFGDDYTVLKTDDNKYFVLQSKDSFFIHSKLWKYFKLLEYTDEEIEDELLPTLNKIFNSNFSNINLLST